MRNSVKSHWRKRQRRARLVLNTITKPLRADRCFCSTMAISYLRARQSHYPLCSAILLFPSQAIQQISVGFCLSNMYFLTLLPLISIVLAAPAPQSKRSTCITQQWNIQQFEAFTAGSTSKNGSHLSFYFTDPNFDPNKILCSRSMQLGASSQTGPNSRSDSNWYPCESTKLSVMYRYQGTSMDLKRTGVDCGK